MSLFLSAKSLTPPEQVNEQKIEIAKIQYEAMMSTLNSVMKSCRSKCIPDEYGENELNKGENTCIDRCVAKFVKLNLIIGQNAQLHRYSPEGLKIYDRFQKEV